MEIGAVRIADISPALRMNVVETHDSTRIGILTGRMVNRSPGQVIGLLIGEIIAVPSVQYAERIWRTAAHGEDLTMGSHALRVHVNQLGSLVVEAGQHHAHHQTHALVLRGYVADDPGSRVHGHAFPIAQLVQATLLSQNPIPVDAIRGSAGQGAQHIVVQLDYFPHRLGSNILARGGPRISTQNHSSAILETQSGGAVIEIHANATVRQDLGQILSGLEKSFNLR